MSILVKLGLRGSASTAPKEEGSNPGGLWYRVERELIPVVRKLLESINGGFGETVDISFSDSPHTMATSTEFIRADASDGNIILNIPASADYSIRFMSVKKTDTSGNTVVVTADGDEDIDGGSTASVTTGQTFIRLIPRGSGYDIA